MKSNRRHFLKSAGLGTGWAMASAAPGTVSALQAAEGQTGRPRASAMKLGMVTYNLGKDWDVAALIKHCAATQFEGVELRTTHAHGVEVSLNKAQRAGISRVLPG